MLRKYGSHSGAELPFIANFTAGAIAGISEILTFYPLGEDDVVQSAEAACCLTCHI